MNMNMEENISLLLSRENIEKCDKINSSDRDEENNLDLFCYINCNNDDSALIRNCRGLVFNDDKLILKAFPYTFEYTVNNPDLLRDKENILMNCRCFKSYEGTLLRVFYFNNKWYVSTHRKLNAFKSKWCGNKTYGELFENALKFEYYNNDVFKQKVGLNESWEDVVLPRFLNTLNKDNQYMFLILNDKNNRIVCDPSEKVMHVGTFLKDGSLNLDVDCCISHTEEVKFNTLDEMMDYVKKIDISKNQGLILFSPHNYQYKIYNDKYYDLLNIRANIPSIKFRYLQLRKDHEKRGQLERLYPDQISFFREYDTFLRDISIIIYNNYVKRYIHKKYEVVSKEMHKVLKDCHKEYIFKRERITVEKVQDVMNNQNAVILNHLIKNHKLQIKRSELSTMNIAVNLNAITI